ncbi:hypothetical protein HQQ88_00760 [Curtobacterium sp. VKM Ac-2861]|uniref:DUF6270 domain-containing protein n=1 Tax=unclassified Curtobacterium TaxID=257496 RepID=UPI00104869C3|nr:MULTISPECIES: DUF6270 domain-containing protein [unclassified Curtobacterium]NQW88830.1 hypothetical protein [Curtobacterium sp. VKM Ac-2861]TCU85926.1 hypothetical protein EDF48_103229 [Curtobacterium sp. PhB191]TDW45687.1 hypothetical protein EDF52_10964 [Curtobacterium sp. PhB42]TDW57829.1 hypothetical protein EDF47_10164 [Curtobacterium sp. PhB190]
MSRIKVGIIGSCVTREAFITRNNPQYKDVYDLGPLAWQTGLVSFLSKPVAGDVAESIEPGAKVNEHGARTMARDIAKTDRADLEAFAPDYLLFDLYSDVRYGLARIGDATITNNPNSFRKTDYFAAGEGFTTLHMANASAEYVPLVEAAVDDLVEWQRRTLPQTTLVLNCFRYSSYYRTSTGDLNFVKYRGDQKRDDLYRRLLRENDRYDSLYRSITARHDLRTIDNRDRSYHSDGDHPYGISPWHFGRPFFQDFMADLDRMVLDDTVVGTRAAAALASVGS